MSTKAGQLQLHSCVLSGDGANWIRGGLDVLPHARFLLDPFHIQLALRDATGSHPVASRLSSLLYTHGLSAVEQVLEDLAKREPERTESIERVLGYLRANSDGLWRSNPSLGTIEGHIDKTLANRMKKRGRRWSKKGPTRWHVSSPLSAAAGPFPSAHGPSPCRRSGRRPQAPSVTRPSGEPTPGRTHQGGIVSHATGRGFAKKLRDIAQAGRADWDM